MGVSRIFVLNYSKISGTAKAKYNLIMQRKSRLYIKFFLGRAEINCKCLASLF